MSDTDYPDLIESMPICLNCGHAAIRHVHYIEMESLSTTVGFIHCHDCPCRKYTFKVQPRTFTKVEVDEGDWDQ